MKYFKIRINHRERDDAFVQIDETELEQAMHCFITGSRGIFSGGPCRGSDIISISEDWHRAMGWNQSHVMGDDDWHDLDRNGVRDEYAGLIAAAKEAVQSLIAAGRPQLIGKPGTVQERLGSAPEITHLGLK